MHMGQNRALQIPNGRYYKSIRSRVVVHQVEAGTVPLLKPVFQARRLNPWSVDQQTAKTRSQSGSVHPAIRCQNTNWSQARKILNQGSTTPQNDFTAPIGSPDS